MSLHEAVYLYRVSTVNELLNGGADVNFKDGEGNTALHVASFYSRAELARVLLSRGASVTVKNSSGCTPGDLAKTMEMKELLTF